MNFLYYHMVKKIRKVQRKLNLCNNIKILKMDYHFPGHESAQAYMLMSNIQEKQYIEETPTQMKLYAMLTWKSENTSGIHFGCYASAQACVLMIIIYHEQYNEETLAEIK